MKNVLKLAALGCLLACGQVVMPAAPNAPTKFDDTNSAHHISMNMPIDNAHNSATTQPSITSDGVHLTGDSVLTGEVTITFNKPFTVTIPAALKAKLSSAPNAAPVDQKTAAATATTSTQPIQFVLQTVSTNNSPYSSQTRLLNATRLHSSSIAAVHARPRTDSSPTAGGTRLFTSTAPTVTTATQAVPTVALAPQLPIMRRSSSPTAVRSTSPKAICICDGFSCVLTCGKCSCGPCCKQNNGVENFTSIATASMPSNK